MFRRLLLFLFIAAPAFGVCRNVASGTLTRSGPFWYCPGTGDIYADGADLRGFIDPGIGNATAYLCGDTIVLEAGKTFMGLQNLAFRLSYPFQLRAQNCAPGKRTRITTTRAAEMAWDYIPDMVDIPRMAKLVASRGSNTANAQIFSTFPYGANGYLIEGIVFSTDPAISQVDHEFMGSSQVNLGTPTVVTYPESYSFDIELYHTLATNGEEETLGHLSDCQNIACTLRSSSGAYVLGGRNMKLTSSNTKGQGGFVPNYGSVLSATLVDGGHGYAAGNTFTINGTPKAAPATGTVTAVSAGVVTTFTLTYGGFGYDTPRDQGTTATSGTGTGLVVNVVTGDGVHFPITAANNEVSPKITATGIADLMDVHPVGGTLCQDLATGRPRCTRGCWDNFGCQLAIVEGFPSDWIAAGARGVVFALYVNANQVALTGATRAEAFLVNGTPINTTGLSTYSGGAVIRPSGPKIDPVYQMQPGIDNVQMVNMRLENGDMTYFGAPGGFATSMGTVTASTWNNTTHTGTINVTASIAPITGEYQGADIGDLIVVNAPGKSSWCGAPTGSNVACAAGGNRIGKITGVTGTYPSLQFTVVPWGAQGIDIAATVGGSAQWKGLGSTRTRMSQSRIVRDYTAFPTGKGAFEAKATYESIYDGNIIDGVLSQESKNQGTGGNPAFALSGAAVPWSTCRNSIFSNNTMLYGGEFLGGDYESSVQPVTGCWFQNNLSAEIQVLGGYTHYWGFSLVDGNSGARHNTALVDPALSPSGNWFPNYNLPLTCPSTGVPSEDEYAQTMHVFANNLASYGVALNKSTPGQNCWPNQDIAVYGNTWLADHAAATTSDITTAWPNDHAVPTWASMGLRCGATVAGCRTASAADHALSDSSPLRGTASDGKDPGADIAELLDHQSGWSLRSGLMLYDSSTASFRNNQGAFTIGSTHTALTFTIFNGTANCSATIYTDPARITEHADTNTTPEKSCTRVGNIYQDGRVTFVFNSLAGGTTYRYKIVDGPRTMVGEFTTLVVESTRSVTLSLKDATATDAQIQFSANADLTLGSTTTPVSFAGGMAHLSYDPATGVRYWRWQKRNGSGTVTQSGPIKVEFRGTPPPAGTSWITGITPGTPAVLNGPVGLVLSVGASPITITALGRYCLAGNTGTHDIKVYNSGAAEIASATVNMAGCTAGTFVYSSPTSIALTATTDYFLASIESSSGDSALDYDTTVTTTSVASDTMSAFFAGSWGGHSDPGHQYVGISFKY